MKTLKFLSWFFLAAMVSMAACSKDDDDNDDDDDDDPVVVADTIAQANLVAYFKFDGNVNDEKEHQVTSDGVTYTFDRHSQANSAYKGSETAFARIENPSDLRVSSITVSLWLRAQTLPGNTNFILSFIDPELDWNRGLAFFQENNTRRSDTLNFKFVTNHLDMSDKFIWTVTEDHPFRPVLFPVSKWFHFLYAYDGSTSIRRVFLDGVKLSTDTLETTGSTPMGPITIPATAQYFYIGHNPNTSQTWIKNYTGDLDDLRIYNAALKDSQIQALYDAEKPE